MLLFGGIALGESDARSAPTQLMHSPKQLIPISEVFLAGGCQGGGLWVPHPFTLLHLVKGAGFDFAGNVNRRFLYFENIQEFEGVDPTEYAFVCRTPHAPARPTREGG